MSGGFNDPVVGGSGTLKRNAIQSPNYVPGTSGWTVKKDGSAEFNNGTFRGTVTAATIISALIESATSGRRTTIDANGNVITYNTSGAIVLYWSPAKDGLFIYADTGSASQGALLVSLAGTSGTDPVNGRSYPQGFATFTSNQPALAGIGVNALGSFGLFFQDTSSAPYTGPNISSPQANAAGTELLLDSGLGLIRPNDADAQLAISSQLKSGITGGVIQFAAGQVQFDTTSEGYWDENAGQLSLGAGRGPFIPGEGWHTVSLPTTGGFTGLIRVKKLPWNMVALDVQVEWTATTGATFNCGSLPDATYYPTSQTPRSYPISMGDTPTAGASFLPPRVIVPGSGALQIFVPSSSAGSGSTAFCGTTVTYPTN